MADRLLMWNPGELPEGWSISKLLGPHPSKPFNPDVANAFFRAGEIEAWGRGIQRIFGACREAGTPEPQIRVEPRDFWVEFPFSDTYLEEIAETGRGGEDLGGAARERNWVEGLGERLGERLGETECAVLLLIHAKTAMISVGQREIETQDPVGELQCGRGPDLAEHRAGHEAAEVPRVHTRA